MQTIEALFSAQRELYNAALEARRGAWRWERRRVSRLDQYAELTGWDDPILAFGVIPARGTLLRLDRAFEGFFRRVRTGRPPGFPRFKSASRWASVEYPQYGCWKVTSGSRNGRLYLMGVGHVRFRTTKRGLPGIPKTLAVRREGHRYRAYVSCEASPPAPTASTGRAVGIDLGVAHLVATSDGRLVANHRLLGQKQQRLAEAQRILQRRKRGSARRRKAAQTVGAINRRVARSRRNYAHQLSRSLVDHYDLIVHEDLQIANMIRRPRPVPDGLGGWKPNGATAKSGLNREIQGAGWGILLRMIAYKAEEAGRTVIAVDPRRTSQACHRCGHTEAGNRSGEAFRCLRCGLTDHADINAARNILRAGLALRGGHLVEATCSTRSALSGAGPKAGALAN